MPCCTAYESNVTMNQVQHTYNDICACVSLQLAQRFWNAHAIVNLAVWLSLEPPSTGSWGARLGVSTPPPQRVKSARVVVGCARTDLDGKCAVNTVVPLTGLNVIVPPIE